MNRFKSRLGLMTSAVAAATLAQLALTPASTATAQVNTFCHVFEEDVSEGDVLYCVGEGDLGLLFQLTMLGTNRMSVAIRHLPPLRCIVNGYNELGAWAGGITMTWDDFGVASSACFWNVDHCYEDSPVVTIDIACDA